MDGKDDGEDLTAPQALDEWRGAERTAAVARRGRLAAAKVAAAARSVVLAATGDVDDAVSDVATSEIAEVKAHERYRQAISRAENSDRS